MAIEFARKNHIPFFGICLGMQVATIEFVRNMAGITQAHSAEFDAACEEKVFLKLKELVDIKEMGHNMRLGEFSCLIKPDTLCHQIYGKDEIFERHRHRYEFNPSFESVIEEYGMTISGKNIERDLVEMVEISNHPWFVGCQFHPEFKSKPLSPHPLFVSFIEAARKNHQNRNR